MDDLSESLNCNTLDYPALELVSRRALHLRSLTELELVFAHRVIDFSYARGVPVARFKRLNYLCAVCGLTKSKMSLVIRRVEASRIVRIDRRDWSIQFCPQPEQWLQPMRISPGLRASSNRIEDWLLKINAPGVQDQPELLPEEPTLDDALYDVYRESAAGRYGPAAAVNWSDPAEIERRCRESLDSARCPEPVHEKVTAVGSDQTGSSRKGDSSEAVHEKVTATIAIGRAKSSPIIGTGHRPAIAGALEEQMDRLERELVKAVGAERGRKYLNWWRKKAGQSLKHTTALRQTLDDYSDNRRSVISPDRWLVTTFNNKCRAIETPAEFSTSLKER